MSQDLDADLLAAHASGDKRALIRLYAQAATEVAESEARAFYLTQAYVFALELDDPRAADLHAGLVAMGCEPPTV